MAFKPTAEQQNAIDARGNVLVSAAAGSGKTAVLVERVIDRMLNEEHPIDADRLLVVTFTNAAAAEMRARISSKLNEMLRENPGNMRILRQQILLDSASVCTIDSFCLELVRDNFQSLGLSPDFKLASEGLMSILRQNAIDTVFDRYYAANDNDFTGLIEMLGANYGDFTLINAVGSVYNHIRSLPFPDEWLDYALGLYTDVGTLEDTVWAKTVFAQSHETVDSALTQLRAAANEIAGVEKLEQCYLPQILGGISDLKQILAAIERRDWDTAFEKSREFKVAAFKPVRGLEDDALKSKIKSIKDGVSADIAKVAALFCANTEGCIADIKATAPYVAKLFEVVRAFSDKLDELKRERGVMDFSDVEYAALRLLIKKKDGEIHLTHEAYDLCERFDEVLVDEYQDTNNLQDTIFYALSMKGERLFLVGDVKQSIYRFRQADPENFLHRKETYPLYDGQNSPCKVILSGNFRSYPPVCNFVNSTFHLLMSKKSAEMDYDRDEELRAAAAFPEYKEACVRLDIVDITDAEKSGEQLEAEHVADYIRQVMESGGVLRDEKSPDTLRPAKYSDFTILLRSANTKARTYVNALKAAGIPVWAELRGGFFEQVEVLMVLSLLRAADNPLRDIPLMGAMMSPFFGFTPDDMAEIRLKNRTAPLFSAALLCAKDGNKKCAEFLEQLELIRNWAASLPSDTLIRRIYEHTGVLAIVRAMDDGSQRGANLLKLLDYARGFEGQGYQGLTGFLRYIDGLENSASGMNPASAVTENDDVVRVMSIHRSKGLQFPICIIAGISTKFNKMDVYAGLVLHENGGIGMKISDDRRGVRYTTMPRQAISKEVERSSLAEEMRVLYVAMTRAESRLVFVSSEKNPERVMAQLAAKLGSNWASFDEPIDPVTVCGARNISEWIYMCAMLHPDGKILRELAGAQLTPRPTGGRLAVHIVHPEERAEQSAAEKTEKSEMPETKADDEEIAKRLGFQYPFAGLKGVNTKYSASELSSSEHSSEYYCTSRPVFLSNQKLTPAQRGTATHQYMQFVDYQSAKKDAEKELVRLVENGFLTKEQGEAIQLTQVKRFFESDLYSRIERANRVLREARFMAELKAGTLVQNLGNAAGEETVVVQGVADCVFFEEDGVVILDFKTDKVKNPDELVKNYRTQLEIYAKALSETYRTPIKQALLYSFALGCEVDVNLDI